MAELVKKQVRKTRQISVRFALICLAAILPLNLLAIVFSAVLYQNYWEKIVSDFQAQAITHADTIALELDSQKAQIDYLFATDSFTQFALDEIDDPSVSAVALKAVLGRVRASNPTAGISFIWNRDDDYLTVSHNNYYYGIAHEEQIKDAIRAKESSGFFSTSQDTIEIEGTLFVGTIHSFRGYTVGVYIDLTRMLFDLYGKSAEPRGDMAILQKDNALISCGKNGCLQHSGTIDKASMSIFVQAQIDDTDLYLAEYLCREDWRETRGLFPIIMFALIILTILSFGVIPVIYLSLRRLLVMPGKQLIAAMERVSASDMTVRLPETADTDEVEGIFAHFNRMVGEIQNLRIKSYEQEIARLKTEAINLKLQVNPHMYLNALNTIYSMSRVGRNAEVCDFAELLMTYFRYIFRSDAEFTTMQDEMAFVLAYQNIQKVRYPGRFIFGYAVDEEAETVLIPRLMVENFVENAVKYAIRADYESEIFVRAIVERGKLRVLIMDDGVGIDAATLEKLKSDQIIEDSSGRHTGIWNTRRRLEYYYGGEGRLNIESAPGAGTTVELIIPVRRTGNEEAIQS